MHKEVIADADFSLLAQISLILFVAAFVLIMARAFMAKREKTEHAKNLPLDDGEIDEQLLSDREQ